MVNEVRKMGNKRVADTEQKSIWVKGDSKRMKSDRFIVNRESENG